MDDAGFLAAIRAAPGDPAPRLIYADFLDDHADPRAGLIRAEERMRELPPFADEYWHLKPERDALRDAAPAGWLAALGYHLSQPIFAHGWPDGSCERGQLMRLFGENWLGKPAGNAGDPRGDRDASESQRSRTDPREGGDGPGVRTSDWWIRDAPDQSPSDPTFGLVSRLEIAGQVRLRSCGDRRPYHHEIAETFRHPCRVGNLRIGEWPGLLTILEPYAVFGPFVCHVVASRLLPREAVPAWVWQMCRKVNVTAATGYFAEERNR